MNNFKVIEKDGRKFFIKLNDTVEYYTEQDLCDCIGCRNYYKQIKQFFPLLDNFLKEFGVDIEKPDEIEWYNNDNEIQYIMAGYTVCGSIDNNEELQLDINDSQLIRVKINQGNYFPNGQANIYFNIIIDNFSLPYILDEPIGDFKPKSKILQRIKSLFKR